MEYDADELTGASAYVKPEAGAGATRLSGMFRQWYLEYASYVILERAVPHIEDGLKPVQRRILHSMQTLDDGRYNKVANIVGNTMQYHPHGDASIGDALVQLGQKELLIDTQGNWGNILTGDSAAAPRYIEARLSEFALEAVFSPKITEWTLSYDGRKREPVTLPVKFPLLLAQGVEGIAVGLSSKILPHNFNEILDAAKAYLRGEEFALYPDFPTGGFIDVSRYNDGARGGSVRIRAKIEKIDSKTLAITEIPYGKTTAGVIQSILTAMDKGKIKVRRVDDNTAGTARIIVHLQPGTSSDKAIDALYAFTDCEVPVSPNCCVIADRKPQFLSVSDLLRQSVEHTRSLLLAELRISLEETRETRHFASLEKIFIEERIYKDRELEEAADMDAAVAHIDRRLEPWKPRFYRAVTTDDILSLWEIKMGRILKFNSDKADRRLADLDAKAARLEEDIANITDYTIRWYDHLQQKYGAPFPRRTVIRGFDSIERGRVAEANRRLYLDTENGFLGTSLREGEEVCACSDIDDVIVFYRDGRYRVSKVQEKADVGKGVIHVGIFRKGDRRTIYNVVYRNGRSGPYYKKRFSVTGLTRDKEYNLTKGAEGSRVVWFSANPNGEAETLRITLKPKPRLKVLQFDLDFADQLIKGRDALGNLVTANDIHRITLKSHGRSTLGGRMVWFDSDVLRLNYEGRGRELGEFNPDDSVLVILNDSTYYTTSFADTNHFPDNISVIEKFSPDKVWTAVLYDAAQGNMPYIKRFMFEPTDKPQRFAGADAASRLILLTDTPCPRLRVEFGGADAVRPAIELEADEFIAVKGIKAKGKRLTTYTLGEVTELEPTHTPDAPQPADSSDVSDLSEPEDDSPISQTEVRDSLTGQARLFTDEEISDTRND